MDSYITARFLSPGLLIALMMEAARTSETLVNFYQTTRCYNQEDSNLQHIASFKTPSVFSHSQTVCTGGGVMMIL
jgi:hypothetical protein